MKPLKYPPEMEENLRTIIDRIEAAKVMRYGKKVSDRYLIDRINQSHDGTTHMAYSYLAELRAANKAGKVQSLVADKLIVLAEELGVTTDYLLGLSPLPHSHNPEINKLGLSTSSIDNLSKLYKLVEQENSSDDENNATDNTEPKTHLQKQLFVINKLLEDIEFNEEVPASSELSRILELIYQIVFLRFEKPFSLDIEERLKRYLEENKNKPDYEEKKQIVDDFFNKGIIPIRDKETGITTYACLPQATDVLCYELRTVLEKEREKVQLKREEKCHTES